MIDEPTEEDTPPPPLVPHFYYRWMQISGFLPYSLSNKPFSRADILWKLWSLCLFVIQIMLFKIAAVLMWSMKGDEVSKLDHYALIQYSYINMFLAQNIIVSIICAVQMRNINEHIEMLHTYLCFPKTMEKLQFRWYLTTGYNITYAVLGTLSDLIYTCSIEPYDYWYREESLALGRYPIPNYAGHMLRYFLLFSVYSSITIPYGIVITIALHLRAEFKVILRILTHFEKITSPALFDLLRLKYQKLLFAKDRLSDTFGVFIALDCFCALLTWCALASETLHYHADHTDRTLLISASFMMLNSLLLLLVLTVSEIQTALRKILISDPTPTVRDECDKFIATCSAFDRAFSAMGFFSVTREYIIALMAIFLTYMILIYQARDVQVKVNAIMANDDVQYHSLADIILNNATAIPKPSTVSH